MSKMCVTGVPSRRGIEHDCVGKTTLQTCSVPWPVACRALGFGAGNFGEAWGSGWVLRVQSALLLDSM